MFDLMDMFAQDKFNGVSSSNMRRSTVSGILLLSVIKPTSHIYDTAACDKIGQRTTALLFVFGATHTTTRLCNYSVIHTPCHCVCLV